MLFWIETAKRTTVAKLMGDFSDVIQALKKRKPIDRTRYDYFESCLSVLTWGNLEQLRAGLRNKSAIGGFSEKDKLIK